MLPNAKGMRGGWTGRAWGQLIGPSAAVRHMRVLPFPAGSLPPLQESYQASGLQAFEEMQPQYNLLAGGWAGGPSLSGLGAARRLLRCSAPRKRGAWPPAALCCHILSEWPGCSDISPPAWCPWAQHPAAP